MIETVLFVLGFLLIFIGTIVILISLLSGSWKIGGKGKVKGGGVVLIGPIPIIFGDKESLKLVIVLAFILTITLFLFYLWSR